MRALVGLAALAACNGSEAFVAIEVVAPADVQRVELFMAPHDCRHDERVTDCDAALAWPGAGRKVNGDTFILDIDTASVADKQPDGSYRIDIKRDTMNELGRLERLLVVGYPDPDGAGQPTVARILDPIDLPYDTTIRWEITLDPVEEIPPFDTEVDRPGRNTQRIHVWNRQSASLERCIVMERWFDDGKKSQRDFLVPPGDTDCDEVDAALECDSFWWNAPPSTPALADAACVTSEPIAGHAVPVCQIGAYACSETDPTLNGMDCVPVAPTHCVANRMCLDQECTDLGVGCFAQPGLSYVLCDIPVAQNGLACDDTSADTSALLRLGELTGTASGECGTPMMGNFFIPFSEVSNPATFGPITVTATETANPDIPCGAEIEVSISNTASIVLEQYGVMTVPFPNGTAATVGLKLKFAPGTCGQGMSCQLFLNPGDNVRVCSMLP